MKQSIAAVTLVIVFAGCGPSEDDLRALIQSEMGKAAVRSEITNARVIGPYSPAVRVGNFLFVSGQIGLSPESGEMAGSTIDAQTGQALQNLSMILQNAGMDSSNVVQCTVFLKDINDFQRMNLLYGGYFPEGHYPARTTVEVSNLPRNAIIEIAAIAYKGPQP